MAKVVKLSKYAKRRRRRQNPRRPPRPRANPPPNRTASRTSTTSSRPQGLDTRREKEIGQHIGYRYDVNLVPDYSRLTPFLKKYMETMGWPDLNWLEDVHLGYEEGRAAVFDRNINGWVTVPEDVKLPDNQQDRDMLARELLDQVPDVPAPSDGRSQQGLSQVLIAVGALSRGRFDSLPHGASPGETREFRRRPADWD